MWDLLVKVKFTSLFHFAPLLKAHTPDEVRIRLKAKRCPEAAPESQLESQGPQCVHAAAYMYTVGRPAMDSSGRA